MKTLTFEKESAVPDIFSKYYSNHQKNMDVP